MTVPIDHLIVDATFANPVIEFPSQDEAIISIDSIVQKAKAMKHKIHIFVYTIGKEEIFIRLAQKYKTQVVVDEDRFRKLKLCEWCPELFTAQETDDSWIYVKNTTALSCVEKMDPEKETVLLLTAWKNKYKIQFENFY